MFGSWRKAKLHDDTESHDSPGSPRRSSAPASHSLFRLQDPAASPSSKPELGTGSSLPASPCKQASEEAFSSSQELQLSSIASLEALMSHRHVEWERQAASADQRQIELFHSQCALIREQIGVFSRSLMTIKGEVQSVQRSEAQLLARLEAEVAQRQVLSSRLESELLGRLEAEVAQRQEFSSRIESDLHELRGSLAETCERLAGRSGSPPETEGDTLAEPSSESLQAEHVSNIVQAEVRALHLEVSQLSDTRLSELTASLEAEARGRGEAEENFNQRLQALTGTINKVQEAQERHNTDLQAQIVQGQEKLFAEKVLYSSEVAKLQESVENLKGQMTEKLEGLNAEKLEAMQVGSGAVIAEEIRSSLRTLQEVVDEEVKACKVGHQDAKNYALQAEHLTKEHMQELSTVLSQAELNESLKADACNSSNGSEEEKAIQQRVDGLRQVLSQETSQYAVNVRHLRAQHDDFRCCLDKLRIGADESSTALQHMNARLEAERRERVNFVAKMPDQFAALSQALGTHVKTLLDEVTERLEHRCTALVQEFMQERAERANENLGLRRSLRGLEERVQALAAMQHGGPQPPPPSSVR